MKRTCFANPVVIGAALAITCLLGTPAFAQHSSSGSSGGSASGGGASGGGASPAGGGSAGGGSHATSGGGAGGGGRAGAAGGARMAGGGGGGWGGHTAAGRASGGTSGGGANRMAAGAGQHQASPRVARTGSVPQYSRPNGGGPTVGHAGARGSTTGTPGDPLGMYGYYSYPMYGYGYGASYFSPYGFGWLGDMYGGFGGYGLGFFPGYGDIGYDPFDPMSASVGLGYDPYAATDPSFVGAGGGTYSSSVPESKKTGALRLHVKPDTASVYVDGNYVGLVNQYNGLFHKLHLDTGTHQVELRADGYQTLAFHVRVESGQVQAYRGELDKTNR